MLHTKTADGRKKADAFSLLELLVVFAVVATLAALLLPTLAKAGKQAADVQCLSNQRLLTLAWHMYASDNNDILAPNDYPYTTPYWDYSESNAMRNWVVGTMEQPIDAQSIRPNGAPSPGLLELSDPNTVLSRYISSVAIWRCPADNFIDPYSKTVHTRSYSMNSAIGTIWWSSSSGQGGRGAPPVGSAVNGGWLLGASYNGNQRTYLTYGKMSSFTRPGPANTWLIMDENPYGINDGTFAAAAATTPNPGPATGGYVIDYPSSNHNAGAAMSFCDGHSIIHTWQNPATYTPSVPVEPGQGSLSSTASTPNPDCVFLAPLTSAPR
jgi:type II secretory pathway pseudopilin PulG